MKNRRIPSVKRHAYPRAVMHDEQQQAAMARRVQYNRDRATPTNDQKWRRLRARILRQQPFCVHCLAKGRHRVSNEVDHIDGDDGNNADSNLQGLCKQCHARKTRRDQFRKANQGGGVTAGLLPTDCSRATTFLLSQN